MFCDEPFIPGHQLKHKRSQMLVMEKDVEEPVDEEIEIIEENGTVQVINKQVEGPQISLNALNGVHNYQTMRVSALHNKKMLQVLIDSGSTHNFLDLDLAKKLGCKLESVTPMSVTAGGGTTLEAPYICRGFTWQLQQTKFTADVLVLPLVCCDLILGIQWLISLGPTVWDFTKLQMEFSLKGKRFVLRGAKPSNIKVINNKTFIQAVQQGAQLCFLHLNSSINHLKVPTCNVDVSPEHSHGIPLAIQNLIVEYGDIFEEPKQLPPSRPGFDHRIPLKEGSNPVNLRPYRYSIIQKDIVDKLVDELLAQGIIQHNNSPYASPAVLVRKKDGSWRLCVDYR